MSAVDNYDHDLEASGIQFAEPDYNVSMETPHLEDPTPDACGKRCCGEEFKRSYGWFTIKEGERTIDVAASFAPRSWPAFLYKIVSMVWICQTLVYKWVNASSPGFFLAYLTHWQLLICAVYSVMSLVASFFPPNQPPHATSSVSWWIKLVWVMYTVSAHLSAIATALYWAIDFKYEGPPTYLNVMAHGGVFVLIWIDGLVVNRIPIRWKHLLFAILIGVAYVSWSIIHQYATDIGNPQLNNTEDNDDLIYQALDFKENPGFSFGLCAAVVFVAIPLIHWILWLLSLYQFPCGGCSGRNRRYTSFANEQKKHEQQMARKSNGTDVMESARDNVNIYEKA